MPTGTIILIVSIVIILIIAYVACLIVRKRNDNLWLHWKNVRKSYLTFQLMKKSKLSKHFI